MGVGRWERRWRGGCRKGVGARGVVLSVSVVCVNESCDVGEGGC